MRICEGGFGQVIWSRPTEQNASVAFPLARDSSVSENYPMISVATAPGLKIVGCSVVLEKFTRRCHGEGSRLSAAIIGQSWPESVNLSDYSRCANFRKGGSDMVPGPYSEDGECES